MRPHPVADDSRPCRTLPGVARGASGHSATTDNTSMGGLPMTTTGHNSIAADRLKSFIERIQKLQEERAGISADIKDVKQEAKSAGFDVPTINAIIKLLAQDPADREEAETLLDVYKQAVGLV
jgi:uncharacterized protein (UPF0335 family)